MITAKRVMKAARRELSKTAIGLQAASGSRPSRNCPSCRRDVIRFYTYGILNWGCPHCNASPRERLVNVCLQNGMLTFAKGAKILHMAPKERSLVTLFSERGEPVFGDISPEHYRHARVHKIDLMDMSSLERFDVFYASHVMEHVVDDRKVFANVHDHLLPGGEAWILVPLHDAPTIDGTADMSARTRERLFGQWDHVRQYGQDLCDRMHDAGFDTSVIDVTRIPASDVHRYGLSRGDKIFIGRRS